MPGVRKRMDSSAQDASVQFYRLDVSAPSPGLTSAHASSATLPQIEHFPTDRQSRESSQTVLAACLTPRVRPTLCRRDSAWRCGQESRLSCRESDLGEA